MTTERLGFVRNPHTLPLGVVFSRDLVEASSAAVPGVAFHDDLEHAVHWRVL